MSHWDECSGKQTQILQILCSKSTQAIICTSYLLQCNQLLIYPRSISQVFQSFPRPLPFTRSMKPTFSQRGGMATLKKENEWGQSLPPHPSTTYWDQVAIGVCPWSGAGWSINQKGICLYCREQATFLMDITSLLFIPCGALEALCSGNLTAGDPCMFYRDSWYLKWPEAWISQLNWKLERCISLRYCNLFLP